MHRAHHDQAKRGIERLVEDLRRGVPVGRDADIDPQGACDICTLGFCVTVTSMEQALVTGVEVGRKDDGAFASNVGEDGL